MISDISLTIFSHLSEYSNKTVHQDIHPDHEAILSKK